MKHILILLAYATISQIVLANNEQKSEVPLSKVEHLPITASKPCKAPGIASCPFVLYYDELTRSLELESEESCSIDYCIYNVEGQIVTNSTEYIESNICTTVDISFLQSGTYSIILNFASMQFSGLFIVY